MTTDQAPSAPAVSEEVLYDAVKTAVDDYLAAKQAQAIERGKMAEAMDKLIADNPIITEYLNRVNDLKLYETGCDESEKFMRGTIDTATAAYYASLGTKPAPHRLGVEYALNTRKSIPDMRVAIAHCIVHQQIDLLTVDKAKYMNAFPDAVTKTPYITTRIATFLQVSAT